MKELAESKDSLVRVNASLAEADAKVLGEMNKLQSAKMFAFEEIQEQVTVLTHESERLAAEKKTLEALLTP